MNKLIYLILAILCSSSIALIFKHSETNNMNRLAVTTANYFTALIISLIMIFIKSNSIFSDQSKLLWAISIGAIAGIFFFLSFIYYQKSVKKNGAGLAGVFSKLGILLPMLISIVLWKEFPTSIQWLGIILAIISIVIVNFPFNKNWKKALKLSLILLFFYGGIAEFSNKLFQRYAALNLKPLFLFSVFSVAFIISLVVTIKDKRKIKREDLFIGVLVGIPNLFSSFFLISALDLLKAAVVFPIFSAGSIVVISLGGFLIYNERLNRREFSAIIMTIIALILINM